jgi:hypothetical protein
MTPGMVARNCNPCTWEAEVGGSHIQGQSGLHRKACLKNKNKIQTK